MDGVHHHGHPGQAGRDPAVEAGLRVVGMDDVGFQPAQQSGQLPESQGVLSHGHGARGMTKGLVADALGGQLLDPRSRSRHPDYIHPGGGKGPQLGRQQKSEAHVGGGHVHEATPRQGAHPAPSRRLA